MFNNLKMNFLRVYNDAQNIKLNIWIKFTVVVDIPFSQSDSQLFRPKQERLGPVDVEPFKILLKKYL